MAAPAEATASYVLGPERIAWLKARARRNDRNPSAELRQIIDAAVVAEQAPVKAAP